MEKKSEEFGKILAEEENLLDRLSEKQKLLENQLLKKIGQFFKSLFQKSMQFLTISRNMIYTVTKFRTL